MRTRKWWHPYPGTFRPVWVIAEAAKIPERTIRTWIRRRQVTAACDIKTREIIVDVRDITRKANR